MDEYRRASPNGDSQAEMYVEAAKAQAAAGPGRTELSQRTSTPWEGFKTPWWDKLRRLPDVFGERESPHRKGKQVTLAVQRRRRGERKARNKRERQARKAMRRHGVI